MSERQVGSSAAYRCLRAPAQPPLDGALDGPVWCAAERSPRFGDMVTGAPGLYDTRAALLWDDEALYVAFWVEEPFVRAEATARDELVFLENDIEVLIDGGDWYYEFELNAAGVIYEVLFIWQDAYRRGGRFDRPEFDLIDRRALSFAGDHDRSGESFWKGTHPRGARWAFREWDLPGLRTAVDVQGTLNDDSDVDDGWRVEIAFPWKGFGVLAGARSIPPRDGDVWRIFLGRFQKLVLSGVEVQPHPAWTWTPHGTYDTHLPERWLEVCFSSADVEISPP